MKLTDPRVIDHLKGRYYIRRECWSKDTGYSLAGNCVVFTCGPMINVVGGFSMEDIEADDWVLCPKE